MKDFYNTKTDVSFNWDGLHIEIYNKDQNIRIEENDLLEFLMSSNFLEKHDLKLQKSEILERDEKIKRLEKENLDLIGQSSQKDMDHKNQIQDAKTEAADKAKKGQINNMKGAAAEMLTPFLEEFPWHPKDVRYIGGPIDFVVFDGMTDGILKRIVFVENKLNKSNLTYREKKVKECVIRKDIDFAEVRLKLKPEWELKVNCWPREEGQTDLSTALGTEF